MAARATDAVMGVEEFIVQVIRGDPALRADRRDWRAVIHWRLAGSLFQFQQS